MRTFILVSTLLAGIIVAPVAAAAPAEKAEPGKGSAAARILGALELPLKAQALRKAGTDEKEVKAGLKAVRDNKVAASDAAELLDTAAQSTREHGPVGNFGAFVKERLGEGLRGKDLAEAIRKEHAARGKGKGHKGDAAGGDAGKPEGVGTPEGAETRENGQAGDAGKPEDAGDRKSVV